MTKYDPKKYSDLIGGTWSFNPEGFTNDPLENWTHTANEYKGVFANYPGATPKYDTSLEGAPNSMARILVPFANPKTRDRYVRSFKDDQTRQIIEKVAVSSGSAAYSNAGGLGYIDFLLQTIQEPFAEKVDIVDTLSDNFVSYFFGQAPPVFTYQGTFLNTHQDDWRAAWTLLYSGALRGTKLARHRRLATLTYDNVAVTGTFIASNQTLTAEMETSASFSFSILVKRYDVYRLVNSRSNSPTEALPTSILDPSNFGRLRLGAVKRTYRTVSIPQTVASSPQKDRKEKPDSPTTDEVVAPTSEDIKQSTLNVRNKTDESSELDNAWNAFSQPFIDAF